MFYNNDFHLGILGGGQLGRMLIQSAIPYDVNISILDPSPNAPCAPYAHEFVCGDFNDYETVLNFGRGKDVVTIEIEHVNTDALLELQKEGVQVYPDPNILKIVQDKGLQKQFYKDNGIATADFELITDKADLIAKNRSFPYIQKMRKGGYDGRGVLVVRNEQSLDQAFDAPSLVEDFVPFDKEISVIVSRRASGETKAFPLVELDFNPDANLVEFLYSPARVDAHIEEKAQALAQKLVDALDFVGILAVEMFLTKDGDVLVNEIAPRTHNSGHHSIEGNHTSQFEQHLRSILNIPLGSTDVTRAAVMVNLLGEDGHQGEVYYEGLNEVLAMPDVHIHLYGKKETKPFRKMGHITVLHDDLDQARAMARKVKETIRVISKS